MTAARATVTPIVWAGDHLRLIDQRVLPHEERWVECRTADDVARAIHDMAVRGAPAIGIAAGYGMALGLTRDPASYDAAEALLAQSRPTAVNLRWVLDRLRRLKDRSAPAVLAEARRIHAEDLRQNRTMAGFGAALLPRDKKGGARVLTHCNTGALATGGHGTALGVIRTAYAQGRIAQVFATETRPWLQGARLTAWELQREGIPSRLIADGAAAWLMAQHDIDWVIVGADRIAANGDTANKIGTYALAVAAARHGVKFMVVAPTGTFDLRCATGADIHIEERAALELTQFRGAAVAPANFEAFNPVFDVTPAGLITALVCENGAILRPTAASVRRLVGGAAGGASRIRQAAAKPSSKRAVKRPGRTRNKR